MHPLDTTVAVFAALASRWRIARRRLAGQIVILICFNTFLVAETVISVTLRRSNAAACRNRLSNLHGTSSIYHRGVW